MLHAGAVGWGWGANLGGGEWEMGKSQTGQIRVTRTVPPTRFATTFLAMIQVRIIILTSIIVFCEASSDRPFYDCGRFACNGTVAKNVVILQLDTLEIGANLQS